MSGRVKVSRHSVMAQLIRARGWKCGVELGVWQGSLFGYLLGAFPELELYGVDRWTAVGEYAGKDMAAAEALARAIEQAHPGRALLIKGDTAESCSLFVDKSVDFVFVDASHDTGSVMDDVREWRPKVRAGGALTGHDANLETVRKALDLSLPGWRTLEANCWIWEVP